MVSRAFFLSLAIAAVVSTGCVTDRERLDIGKWERVEEPAGMFPRLADKQTFASTQVTYYFKAGREKMLSDTGLTLKVIAYFEWLANDLRTSQDIPASSLRKVMDARNDLREIIKIPANASTTEALNQLYSMSKFMAVANQAQGEEDPKVVAYRKFLLKARGEVDRLLKQALEGRDSSAKTAPAPEKGEQR